MRNPPQAHRHLQVSSESYYAVRILVQGRTEGAIGFDRQAAEIWLPGYRQSCVAYAFMTLAVITSYTNESFATLAAPENYDQMLRVAADFVTHRSGLQITTHAHGHTRLNHFTQQAFNQLVQTPALQIPGYIIRSCRSHYHNEHGERVECLHAYISVAANALNATPRLLGPGISTCGFFDLPIPQATARLMNSLRATDLPNNHQCDYDWMRLTPIANEYALYRVRGGRVVEGVEVENRRNLYFIESAGMGFWSFDPAPRITPRPRKFLYSINDEIPRIQPLEPYRAQERAPVEEEEKAPHQLDANAEINRLRAALRFEQERAMNLQGQVHRQQVQIQEQRQDQPPVQQQERREQQLEPRPVVAQDLFIPRPQRVEAEAPAPRLIIHELRAPYNHLLLKTQCVGPRTLVSVIAQGPNPLLFRGHYIQVGKHAPTSTTLCLINDLRFDDNLYHLDFKQTTQSVKIVFDVPCHEFAMDGWAIQLIPVTISPPSRAPESTANRVEQKIDASLVYKPIKNTDDLMKLTQYARQGTQTTDSLEATERLVLERYDIIQQQAARLSAVVSTPPDSLDPNDMLTSHPVRLDWVFLKKHIIRIIFLFLTMYIAPDFFDYISEHMPYKFSLFRFNWRFRGVSINLTWLFFYFYRVGYFTYAWHTLGHWIWVVPHLFLVWYDDFYVPFLYALYIALFLYFIPTYRQILPRYLKPTIWEPYSRAPRYYNSKWFSERYLSRFVKLCAYYHYDVQAKKDLYVYGTCAPQFMPVDDAHYDDAEDFIGVDGEQLYVPQLKSAGSFEHNKRTLLSGSAYENGRRVHPSQVKDVGVYRPIATSFQHPYGRVYCAANTTHNTLKAFLSRQCGSLLQPSEKVMQIYNEEVHKLRDFMVENIKFHEILLTFDEYLQSVESKKRPVYKQGYDQFMTTGVIDMTMEGMMKTKEFKLTPNVKSRNLFNPSPTMKAIGGYCNKLLIMATQSVLPNFVIGKTPEETAALFTEATKRYTDPVHVSTDFSAYDSHMSKCHLYLDQVLIKALLPTLLYYNDTFVEYTDNIIDSLTRLDTSVVFYTPGPRKFRKILFKGRLADTTYSGHPVRTSWGNTLRSLVMFRVVQRDFPHLCQTFHTGDDANTILEKAHVRDYVTTLYQYFSPTEVDEVFGLGHVLKECKIGKHSFFCSKVIYNEFNTVLYFRPLNRMVLQGCANGTDLPNDVHASAVTTALWHCTQNIDAYKQFCVTRPLAQTTDAKLSWWDFHSNHEDYSILNDLELDTASDYLQTPLYVPLINPLYVCGTPMTSKNSSPKTSGKPQNRNNKSQGSKRNSAYNAFENNMNILTQRNFQQPLLSEAAQANEWFNTLMNPDSTTTRGVITNMQPTGVVKITNTVNLSFSASTSETPQPNVLIFTPGNLTTGTSLGIPNPGAILTSAYLASTGDILPNATATEWSTVQQTPWDPWDTAPVENYRVVSAMIVVLPTGPGTMQSGELSLGSASRDINDLSTDGLANSDFDTQPMNLVTSATKSACIRYYPTVDSETQLKDIWWDPEYSSNFVGLIRFNVGSTGASFAVHTVINLEYTPSDTLRLYISVDYPTYSPGAFAHLLHRIQQNMTRFISEAPTRIIINRTGTGGGGGGGASGAKAALFGKKKVKPEESKRDTAPPQKKEVLKKPKKVKPQPQHTKEVVIKIDTKDSADISIPKLEDEMLFRAWGLKGSVEENRKYMNDQYGPDWRRTYKSPGLVLNEPAKTKK